MRDSLGIDPEMSTVATVASTTTIEGLALQDIGMIKEAIEMPSTEVAATARSSGNSGLYFSRDDK